MNKELTIEHMLQHLSQVTPLDGVGIAGALIYSGLYLLSAYDRLPSQSPLYYAGKLVAAVLVLVSLTASFNLAATLIQVFYIGVSVIGVQRHLGARRRRRAYEMSLHAPAAGAMAAETVVVPTEDPVVVRLEPCHGHGVGHGSKNGSARQAGAVALRN